MLIRAWPFSAEKFPSHVELSPKRLQSLQASLFWVNFPLCRPVLSPFFGFLFAKSVVAPTGQYLWTEHPASAPASCFCSLLAIHSAHFLLLPPIPPIFVPGSFLPSPMLWNCISHCSVLFCSGHRTVWQLKVFLFYYYFLFLVCLSLYNIMQTQRGWWLCLFFHFLYL